MAIRTEQEALINDVKNNTGTALSPAGAILIDDTNAQTGPFFAITSIGAADAVIDTSECDVTFIKHRDSSGDLDALPATITIPKGVTIYGNFASIELDSGSVIAYSL